MPSFSRLVRAASALLLQNQSGLIVSKAPSTPQPYVIRNLDGEAFSFGETVVRVLVTNGTTEGGFSLTSLNSQSLSAQAIHSHLQGEGWYVMKGAANLWALDEGRLCTQGDFHYLPSQNYHSYMPIDLDTQVTQFLSPGGSEVLYEAVGPRYNSSTNAPFNATGTSEVNATLAYIVGTKLGLIFYDDKTLNNDFVNGTTPDGLGTWHRDEQSLPSSALPYFVSNNLGPKYLVPDLNQVVSPLATGMQTGNNVSIAAIALGLGNVDNGKSQSFNVHQAIQVTEGQLNIEMAGETVGLIFGDVAFVPMETPFKYWGGAGFTKFTIWAAGPGVADESLASQLVKVGHAWDYAVWPAN